MTPRKTMTPRLTSLHVLILCCLALLSLPMLSSLSPAGASEIRIIVPARDIARGEIIQDSDLVSATISAGQMRATTITAASQLHQMQARRFLRAGDMLRSEDVRAPVIVTKGQTVSMIFDAPGISLSATGRALSEGGKGDMVTILNPVTYRQIMATVIGPAQVRAENALPLPGRTPRLAAIPSPQLAQ